MFAITGINYFITDEEAKLCKRVGAVSSASTFTENNSLDLLDEEIEKENTKILFHFLKGYFDEVTMKHGRVHCAGYKMKYSAYGFEVIDMLNFGRGVNCNQFNNDMPSPDAVLQFIRDTQHREVEPTPEDVKEKEVVKIIENLKEAGYKVTRMKEGKVISQEVVEHEKPLRRDLTETAQLFEANWEAFKTNKMSATEFKFIVTEGCERAVKTKIGVLFNKLEKKELNKKSFPTKMREMLEKLQAPKQEEKRAPKFYAPTVPAITEITKLDDLTISYHVKGEKREVTEPLAVYLTRELLAEEPKMNVTIMKLLKGEEAQLGEILKDPFQHFAWYSIVTADEETQRKVIDYCIDTMHHWELPTILDRHTMTAELRKDANVWVYIPQRFKWLHGTIVEVVGGIKVRLTDTYEVIEAFKYMTLENEESND